MLKHTQDIGFRAGSFVASPIPASEIEQVLSILDRYYGPERDVAAIVPLPNEAQMRAEIRHAAPQLDQLAQAMREILETSHTGLVIPKIGLDHLDLATRSFVLYALSLCIGSPTPTDKLDQRIVWDIKVREDKLKNGSVSTFSEHAYVADFHTDTQYFPEPERYLLLYCVTPAACGGGRSTFRDIDCVKQQLAQTEEGRWAIDFLSRQELPFRIPATFTTTGTADRLEVTFAKVLGQRPLVKYRRDTLEMGLEAFPEFDTPDVRRALGIFWNELENHSLTVGTHLESDAVLIANNHDALHGRSDFTDYNRHVLRIRIADQVPQDATRSLVQDV